MQTTSDVWKRIVATGDFNLESVAIVYGATGSDINGTDGSDSTGSYKEYATITAPEIDGGLLQGDALAVGNTISNRLNFTLMTTDTIPKSARIRIKGRVVNNEETSEYIDFGTFWIDHREQTDDLIDIEAYDAMKMGNQAYADDSQALNWPKDIKTVVQRIAVQMGVSIDSRTVTEIINDSVGDLQIITKPNEGDTLLTILGHIAEILGGNWIITPANELRYVQLTRPVEIRGYLLDHEDNIITTNDGTRLLWQGEAIDD